MRKHYLLFTLLVWLALPSSAKIVVGDQITASQITEGALIVIQDTKANSSSTTTDWNGWYFDNTTNCTKLVSPNMTWRVVKATADEQGRQQYYLQNLGDSLYMGPMFQNESVGTYGTYSIDSAYQLRFEDYNQTATTRYDFNEKSVVAIVDFSAYATSTRYQTLDVEANNLESVRPSLFYISFASFYGMDGANGSPINVFAAQEVQDYASDLQTQLDIITSANESFPPARIRAYMMPAR